MSSLAKYMKQNLPWAHHRTESDGSLFLQRDWSSPHLSMMIMMMMMMEKSAQVPNDVHSD